MCPQPGRRLGLASLPDVSLSRRLHEALVIGLWRPVILLPWAWVADMPPEALEAVLAHELAHVRRWDLWVSLGQRLVEALLFYHPAVWWISRRISLERELCADELAVTATGQRLAYAETLALLGHRRLGRPLTQLGIPVGGRSMTLLHRVLHVLGLDPSEKRLCWVARGAAGPFGAFGPLAYLSLFAAHRSARSTSGGNGASPPAPSPAGPVILATVNGQPIRESEVLETVIGWIPQAGSPEEVKKLLKVTKYLDKVLDDVIERELLYQKAMAEIDKNPRKDVLDKLKEEADQEFNWWLQAAQAKFPSQEQFLQYLQDRGTSLESQRRLRERVFIGREFRCSHIALAMFLADDKRAEASVQEMDRFTAELKRKAAIEKKALPLSKLPAKVTELIEAAARDYPKKADGAGQTPILKVYPVPAGRANELVKYLTDNYQVSTVVRVSVLNVGEIMVYAPPVNHRDIAKMLLAKAPGDTEKENIPDRLRRAEKDYREAEFYRRTDKLPAAYFQYEVVRRLYPDTKYAEMATEQMGQIREKVAKDQLDIVIPPPSGSGVKPGGKAQTLEETAVKDKARELLAAIRDKKDDRLKEFTCDLIPGWTAALPYFAREIRSALNRFAHSTEPINHIEDVFIKGDFAAVKTGSGPGGTCLVLFFSKTFDGWRNSSLRNAPGNASLKDMLEKAVQEYEKTVKQRAATLIGLAEKGKFAEVTAAFDGTMRKALPEAKLAELWRGLEKDGGKFLGQDPARGAHTGWPGGFCALPLGANPAESKNRVRSARTGHRFVERGGKQGRKQGFDFWPGEKRWL